MEENSKDIYSRLKYKQSYWLEKVRWPFSASENTYISA